MSVPKPTFKPAAEIASRFAPDKPEDSFTGVGKAEALSVIDKPLPDPPTQAPKPLVSTNPKDQLGVRKPGFFAIPPSALLHLGRAMDEGQQKYGIYNWRKTKVQSDIYVNALLRHLFAWVDGEEMADGPLKCHHLAHVLANAAILLDAIETNTLIDTRGVPGNANEIIADWTTKG